MSEAERALLIVIVLIALVMLLPAKYDPVIRLREWLDRGRPR